MCRDQAWAQPLDIVRLCKFARCKAKHYIDRLGRLRLFQLKAVSLNEFDQRQPGCALATSWWPRFVCAFGAEFGMAVLAKPTLGRCQTVENLLVALD